MEDVPDCKLQFISSIGRNGSTFDYLNMLITVTDQESPVIAITDLLHIVFTGGFYDDVLAGKTKYFSNLIAVDNETVK